MISDQNKSRPTQVIELVCFFVFLSPIVIEEIRSDFDVLV